MQFRPSSCYISPSTYWNSCHKEKLQILVVRFALCNSFEEILWALLEILVKKVCCFEIFV